jgi:sulfur-carrier protein
MRRVRLTLPAHLRTLAGVTGEVELQLSAEPTLADLLDALEERHPVLRGTIRDHRGAARRPLLRFYADGRDLSHEPLDTPLPSSVTTGGEALHVVGAIAGG